MYIAKKPCSFAGQVFRIGDAIPINLVQPQAAQRLINGGYIAKTTPPVVETLNPVEIDTPHNVYYKEYELVKMSRGDLLNVAKGVGVEVADNDTKKSIVACIMDVQGSDK